MILQRHPGRPVARSVTVAGLAVLGLLLSGCGGALGIHPGSAVVVGTDSVSMDKIDTDSGLICQAFLPQLQQGGQKVPMRYVRQVVATRDGRTTSPRPVAASTTAVTVSRLRTSAPLDRPVVEVRLAARSTVAQRGVPPDAR